MTLLYEEKKEKEGRQAVEEKNSKGKEREIITIMVRVML